MDTQSFFEDILGRVNRLESHLFNGGKGIVQKVSKLEATFDSLSVNQQSINELENRLIVLEERYTRQRENVRLRQAIDFINAFPFGWKGVFTLWVVATAVICGLVEATDISKMIANFLGAK